MARYPINIGGRLIELEWTQETARRYEFRIGLCGGEPTPKQLQNPATVATALFRMLWALLPVREFQRHESPEELFLAVDHEEEAPVIYAALRGIFEDRAATVEKKSSGKKSPSPGSSSDSVRKNGSEPTPDSAPPT